MISGESLGAETDHARKDESMTYGLIGLGAMGRAMAERWLKAGHNLVVYNRTREKSEKLAEQYPGQVVVADHPRDVALGAKYILSMVADDQAIQDVVGKDNDTHGLAAVLDAEHVWVDSSTISPKMSRHVSSIVSARNAVRLEAPVSGSVDAAQEGRLLMFIGGDQTALEKVRSMLDPLTARIEWVGDVGQALALKLGINLNLALQIEGFVEGMMVAESAGLPREKVAQYMLESVIASPSMKYRVPMAFNPPDQPWFTMTLMLKDLRLALEQAGDCCTTIPLTSLTADLMRLAVRNGYGQEDFAALINYMSFLASSPAHNTAKVDPRE
jgi:3-hydroxyisobutyrate dehydrogenase-like beta-hydroxyacid dehydrogenase